MKNGWSRIDLRKGIMDEAGRKLVAAFLAASNGRRPVVLAVVPSLERRCSTPGAFAASLEALTDAKLDELHGRLR